MLKSMISFREFQQWYACVKAWGPFMWHRRSDWHNAQLLRQNGSKDSDTSDYLLKFLPVNEDEDWDDPVYYEAEAKKTEEFFKQIVKALGGEWHNGDSCNDGNEGDALR